MTYVYYVCLLGSLDFEGSFSPVCRRQMDQRTRPNTHAFSLVYSPQHTVGSSATHRIERDTNLSANQCRVSRLTDQSRGTSGPFKIKRNCNGSIILSFHTLSKWLVLSKLPANLLVARPHASNLQPRPPGRAHPPLVE